MLARSVRVEGQTIDHTYMLDVDVVGEPMLASLQCDFSLCEADFLRLKGRYSKWLEAAIAVLLLSVGYAISIAAKYINSMLFGGTPTVERWEYFALAIGLAAALILFICARCLPNEKQKLLREMEQHFRKYPRQRRVMRRVDEHD